MKGEQCVSWSEFQAASREARGEGDRSHEEGVSEGSAMAEDGAEVMWEVELENEELWKQFDENTNEMIITKAGRYAIGSILTKTASPW